MAITVDFVTTDKKVNSTYRPAGTSTIWRSFSVVLKAPCSILAPVIELKMDDDTTAPNYNYAYIATFGRYYWVENWTYQTALNVWRASLNVDVLATYKDQIGPLTEYIVRAAANSDGSAYSNDDAIDTTYPALSTKPYFLANAIDNPLSIYRQSPESVAQGGVFVVGIANRQGSIGGINYYIMDSVYFYAFCYQIFNSIDWADIDTSEISENLAKALVNPYQYITSCIWLPLNINNLSSFTTAGLSTVGTIFFGYWSVYVSAEDVGGKYGILKTPGYNDLTYSRTSSIAIPRHPYTGTSNYRGYWLNLAPFAQYTLRYYPFGTINIDAAKLAHFNTLDLYVDIDLISGAGYLTIAVNGKSNPIDTVCAEIGVPVALASSTISISGLASGAVAGAITEGVRVAGDWINTIGAGFNAGNSAAIAASGSASGQTGAFGLPRSSDHGLSSRIFGATGQVSGVSDIGENVTSIFENITNGAKSLISSVKDVAANIGNLATQAATTVSSRGQPGTMNLANNLPVSLSGLFFYPAAEDRENRGRPALIFAAINTFSGFLKIDNAHAPITGTVAEQQAVEAFMEAGFYYE